MSIRLPVFLLLFCFLSSPSSGQDNDLLSPAFHRERREALRQLLPGKSAVVIFANPVRNRSNDVDFQYHPGPNIHYLTGHTGPDALLILFKEPRNIDGQLQDEVLFVQPRDARDELWTGKRPGPEGVKQQLGIGAAYANSQFEAFGINWNSLDRIFVEWPDLPNSSREDPADLHDLSEQLRTFLQPVSDRVDSLGLKSLMGQLREVKTEEERGLLQKAVDITIEGFREMMGRMEPGMREYEAQAFIEYHAKKNGAEYMGYPSICGGGENSCVLHYTSNRKKLRDGELLLVDMGAEYHGYTADITRTVPVSGRFTPVMKQLYEVVLAAQDSGIAQCRAGKSFRAAHEAAQEVIADGLMKLGIIRESRDAGDYFMHGTSHYLGLDVHDAGTYGPLKAGVVMTVEPGVYIPERSPCDPKWWGMGIRIEDDILVTDDGPVILSRALPRTVAGIEAWMAEGD